MLNNRKYTRSFFLLSLLLLIICFSLALHISEKRSRIGSMEAEIAMRKKWKPAEGHGNRMAFLGNLLQTEAEEEISAAFEASGCMVEEVAETAGEEADDSFRIFHVKGKGSFIQIVSAFDIIKAKERWTASELRSLKRMGGLLAFEAEVRTVQSRGTYEKKKYSPHRAHGYGQEQSSENTG